MSIKDMVPMLSRIRGKISSEKKESLRSEDSGLARKEARRLWDAGNKNEALLVLGEQLLKHPTDSPAWMSLFDMYTGLKEYSAAAVAVINAHKSSPLNMRALEMLIEVSHERKFQGEVTEAYKRTLAALGENAGEQREVLGFFVPARFDEGLDALENSRDPVVRAVIARARKTDSEISLSEEEKDLVEFYDNIIFGRARKAVECIRALPDDEVPIATLRVSIRRYLRAAKNQIAAPLLEEYLRLNPGDGWAKEKLRAIGNRELTNYQLAKVGFPFGTKRSSAAYEPNLSKSLYLLHNSLPYHSAGYATRTHGLLQSILSYGWDIEGVTRLGYPFDMPKFEELKHVDPVDVVDGVHYHRLSVTSGIERKAPIQNYVARYSKVLEQLAREEKPFVLHGASNHWNGLTAVETARKLGIASIYEVRGLWEVTRGSRDPEWAGGGMYKFMARMEADAARKADRVLTITNALKEELISRGVSENKITVLPNGVDSDRFVPREPDLALKASLGLEGTTVIGYIGSVLDYEGLGLLIDAAKILKRRGRKFSCMIVGDGAELEKFQDRVVDEGLSEVFIFTGRVPHEDVERYYSFVDIAPFPRLPLPVCEMVSPLKPFEAMAMGKAVVASDVQALTEIVQNEVNGLLHKKGNAESLAEKIDRYLTDPDFMKEMANAGREWVVRERQWKDLGRIASDIYLDLGGTPGTSQK